MGIVFTGFPKDLGLKLSRKFDINILVETGSYFGDTALWASNYFVKVYTIEKSKKFYSVVKSKVKNKKNILLIFGDSGKELSKIVPEIKDRCIYWLDAHWSLGGTSGRTYQCPLIEELNNINKQGKHAFIFIDDARLFLSPPPKPLSIKQWPDISKIINILNEIPSRYIIVFQDVIICVPEYAKEHLSEYCQKLTTQDNTINNKFIEFKINTDVIIIKIKKLINMFKEMMTITKT